MSAPFNRADLERLPNILPQYSTELHLKSGSNLTLFSDRAIKALEDRIERPAALRRIIYTGAREGICAFPVQFGTATTVPLAMIIAPGLKMSILVFLFPSVLRLRRKIFFEIGNPIDWARQIVRLMDDLLGEDLVLTGIEGEEGIVMQVSTSASMK